MANKTKTGKNKGRCKIKQGYVKLHDVKLQCKNKIEKWLVVVEVFIYSLDLDYDLRQNNRILI